jgi:phosphatidylethanolamine-binding protein (PEBP) family uncharacterized protein
MSLEDYASALAASLEKAQLVPGPAASLIPSSFSPSNKLTITFGTKEVDVGKFFRAGECKVIPDVSFTPEAGASSSASYTLILTDPDAPTPDDPKFAFWRHWVLSGLQLLSGDGGQVAQTKGTVTEYLGPGPKDEYGDSS